MAKVRSLSDLPPAFCPFPWLEQSFDIHGNLQLCSRSKLVRGESGETLNVKDSPDPNSLWNCSSMRKIRQQMLCQPQLPEECRRCSEFEALGQHSKRTSFMRAYPTWAPDPQELIQSTDATGSTNLSPSRFELRVSNLCQAKCVTCSAEYSSSLILDHLELQKRDPVAFRLVRPVYEQVPKPSQNWATASGYYDWLYQNLGKVKSLYFSGGEPLLVKPNTELIDTCIASGLSRNIELTYDTNALLISEAWLRRWDHFDRVNIRISVDGIGDKYNYIRFPGPWSSFERAAQLLAAWKNPRATVMAQITVHLLNLLDLSEIFSWFWELFGSQVNIRSKTHWKIIRDPVCLSLIHAPEATVELARSRVADLATSLDADARKRYLDQMLGVFELVRTQSEPRPEYQEDAVRLLSGLDLVRQTNWRETFPELSRLLAP
ncbi:MAG: radical SAM protein [Bdellovibrionales bacterium]|nr:radical SAM protein [Bdellovibrionales bacterium]